MKKLIALIASLLLLNGFATAQVDLDPNSMGLYFDTEATINDYDTTAPFESVSTYLVIANPTGNGVAGWECSIAISGAPVAPSWAYAGGGLNIADAVTSGLFNVGVGAGELALRAVSNVCVLATFTCFVMSPADEILFTLYPFPSSATFDDAPGYVDGEDVDTVIPCGVSSGMPYGSPCATINSTYVPVKSAEMTWGGVKALYN